MMLSIAQAREIATKEWEENYPQDKEKIERSKRKGDELMETGKKMVASISQAPKQKKNILHFFKKTTGKSLLAQEHLAKSLVSHGAILSGFLMKVHSEDEKNQWITFRTEQLVKDSMKSA